MLIISQSCQSIWMEFGVLLRLVSVMNLILILSRPFCIQGREHYVWFCEKEFLSWLVLRHLQTNFLQTWYDDRDHLALHFEICVNDLNLHPGSQMYEKSKFGCTLSLSIWMKISALPQPVGLLKLMLNLFCTSYSQGRELSWHDL